MRTLCTILVILLISCQNKKKEEVKQDNTQSISPFIENECPDSAITFEEYKNYSSEDLIIDKNVLNLFDTSKHKFSETLNNAIRIENSRQNKIVFELFKRQNDSVNVLVPLKKAKLVKGEAPYSEEYYIYKSDTLFANSTSPIYYYYDDSLRLIEYYYYENVEGCSFGKMTKYINKNNTFLIRSYGFRDNCDNKEYEWTAKFDDTYSFIINEKSYNFEKKLKFYICRFSEYSYNYIYTTEKNSNTTNISYENLADVIKLE